TYLPWSGGSTMTECVPCPPGMYCEGAGQPVPSGRCQDGYYCPQGASSPTELICPENHFCKGSAELISVTTGKDATATVLSDFVGAKRPGNAVDGQENTGWLSAVFQEGENHSLEIDLGSYYFISRYEIYSGLPDGQHAVSSFFLMTWSDAAADWIMATSPVEDSPATTHAGPIVQLYTRKVKLVVHRSRRLVFLELYRNLVDKTSAIRARRGPTVRAEQPQRRKDISAHLLLSFRRLVLLTSILTILRDLRQRLVSCRALLYGRSSSASCVREPCLPGTFSDAAQEECSPCSAGFYCPDSKIAGRPKELCTEGHYCPEGSIFPKLCPPGTVSSSVGAAECTPCMRSHYCSDYGLTAPTDLCEPGYVCVAGAKAARPSLTPFGPEHPDHGACPRGHYCPRGTYEPTPCHPGTYQVRTASCVTWPRGSRSYRTIFAEQSVCL
ncbi:unnamed protein product, partial [Rangifer tarandus platyrhynchus]